MVEIDYAILMDHGPSSVNCSLLVSFMRLIMLIYMASAMIDLMPAFTFILVVITGMEILDLRITSRHAKCIGTAVSISGAKCFWLAQGGCCRQGWGG
ncbi:hypothetical protein Pyn_15430 [Prunus yedoensis var. nudiflora]|uniref:Uncharacterized protein n=1 Tax=Prunus yedoensis var. nudiflora TaxID=2094558 RepID=A0A314YVB3_PRUYE|nr:hypothetical protein Pyn_15430 [Prunus yedoensis var. nudiflora]